jgi:hypothetical protein
MVPTETATPNVNIGPVAGIAARGAAPAPEQAQAPAPLPAAALLPAAPDEPLAAAVRTLPGRIAWLRAGSLPAPAAPLPVPPADVDPALPLGSAARQAGAAPSPRRALPPERPVANPAMATAQTLHMPLPQPQPLPLPDARSSAAPATAAPLPPGAPAPQPSPPPPLPAVTVAIPQLIQPPTAPPASPALVPPPQLVAPPQPALPPQGLLTAAIDAVRPTRRSQGDSGASEAPASPPAAELQLAPPSPSVAAPALAPSAAVRAAPLPEPTPTLAIASDRLGFVQVAVSGSADRLEVSLSATSTAAPILAGEALRLAQDLAAAGVALASYAVNGQHADLAADTANPLAGNAGSSAGSNGTAAGHSQQQPQAQASPAPAPEPGRRDSGVLRPIAARQTPSPDRFA